MKKLLILPVHFLPLCRDLGSPSGNKKKPPGAFAQQVLVRFS